MASASLMKLPHKLDSQQLFAELCRARALTNHVYRCDRAPAARSSEVDCLRAADNTRTSGTPRLYMSSIAQFSGSRTADLGPRCQSSYGSERVIARTSNGTYSGRQRAQHCFRGFHGRLAAL